MVHQIESETIAYNHMLSVYRDRGDSAMVRRLKAAPVTMSGGTPDAYLRVRDTAMHRLGIGTTHDMGSVITGIFWPSWWFPGYTPRERLALWRGRAFSRRFGFWDQFLRVDLRQTVPELSISDYFLEGRYDYTCVSSLARQYADLLRSPVKGFYLFEHSAHSPVLEEPGVAHAIVEHDVLNGRTSLAGASRAGSADEAGE